MLIESSKIGSHLLLQVEEDILMDNSKDFIEEFETVFRKEKDSLEILSYDFSSVRFLDSSGIGAIIKSTNKAKEKGIKVHVVNLNKTLVSVFRLSGLEHILESIEADDFFKQYPQFSSLMRKKDV